MDNAQRMNQWQLVHLSTICTHFQWLKFANSSLTLPRHYLRGSVIPLLLLRYPSTLRMLSEHIMHTYCVRVHSGSLSTAPPSFLRLIIVWFVRTFISPLRTKGQSGNFIHLFHLLSYATYNS